MLVLCENIIGQLLFSYNSSWAFLYLCINNLLAIALIIISFCIQVIKGLDQGILGGDGVSPMHIGMKSVG